MYTLSVPFNDYKGKPHRENVTFNLDARDVFRMLPELKSVFDWLESNRTSEPRELSAEEVSGFYTNFENILLQAYGEMSEDAMHFKRGGKYDFEESALFNACMVLFVMKPEETVKLLEGMMPPELFEWVQKADAGQVAASTEASTVEAQAEIARLKAQLAAQSSGIKQT